METSDSECFESADEDFEYDNQPTKSKNYDLKASSNLESVTDVATKIQNLTIKTIQIDESPSIPDPSISLESTTEYAVEEKKKEKGQRREPKEQKNKKEPKPKLGTKLGHKIDTKTEKQTSNAPPRREQCWEPGVDYQEVDKSHNQEVCNKNAPPRREECWEPGVNDTYAAKELKEKDFIHKSNPPRREECWEPGMDYEEVDESDQPEVSKKNIPPKREECWEPGMNYIPSDDQNKSNKNPTTSPQEEQEENLWGADDDWETVPNVKTPSSENIPDPNASKSSGWGGWGNWGGVSSIISTATHGVTTLTSHVSQGITTVLESSIGVPDPEELARLHRNEQDIQHPTAEDSAGEEEDAGPTIQTVFGLGNLVSGVSHITKLVETTSNKVLTGGLDTLEIIGKKTMEVLQEGDPGLKKKRAFLKINQDKPCKSLSQVLREAKAKAEEENKLLEERHFQKRANYETLFDDNQGLVHLEALEMLSRQCDIKLETIMSTYNDVQLKEMQETMSQVRELCEIPEDDEEEVLTNEEIKEKLEAAVADLNVPINYDRLNSIWVEAEAWLMVLNLDVCNERELHQQAIETLAHLTALAVEQFHKSGELLLIKEHRSTADEADSLVQ